MVKSKMSQINGRRMGIITYRLKKADRASSWLYVYLEDDDRFIWFHFVTDKQATMELWESECWDIIRSYEYFGKPKHELTADTEPRNAEFQFYHNL